MTENAINQTILPLPDKRYHTIKETSELCSVKPHVLRYWEEEFKQLNPVKRCGGRRYYQKKDIILINQIKDLLYTKGFTIAGAKKQLSIGNNNSAEIEINKHSKKTDTYNAANASSKKYITNLIEDLKNLLEKIK